jgi:hypothetical protein
MGPSLKNHFNRSYFSLGEKSNALRSPRDLASARPKHPFHLAAALLAESQGFPCSLNVAVQYSRRVSEL